MKTFVVIGKNFGDEGKGLVTASLSLSYKNPLIIKSNGGAQAGHTVESAEKNSRFIHHQTGSGSEFGATTLWTETYHPDLYVLDKEITEFIESFGFIPKLFSEPNATITTIDDVIINMAIETKRNSNRHGSCGMGIYECCLRNNTGFSLTMEDIFSLSETELLNRFRNIRKDYSQKRAKELGLTNDDTHMALLSDDNILENYAAQIKENARFIQLTSADESFLYAFDAIIFENGQGLLLDEDNERFSPNVSASKTGLFNPMLFLKKRKLLPDEVLYVTRPYVTRHGAGFLPCECKKDTLEGVETDKTNISNEWQGTIRYAKHESTKDFLSPILMDLQLSDYKKKPSLVITHMDETKGLIHFNNQSLNLDAFKNMFSKDFQNIYISTNREGFHA